MSQGPFVMNTREEVMQAAADFQAGKLGDLEDPFFSEEWCRQSYLKGNWF